MFVIRRAYHPLVFALSCRSLRAKPLSGSAASFARCFSDQRLLNEQASPPAKCSRSPSSPSPVAKPSLKERVMAELRHYWHGTKLFASETKSSYALLKRYYFPTRGPSIELTRREVLQLARSRGDVLKVFPFMIFVIVPFLEFALPVFLKLFPNMLPSTFETVEQREAKYAKAEERRRAAAVLLRAWLRATHPKVLEGVDAEPWHDLSRRLVHLHALSLEPGELAQPLLGHVCRFVGLSAYYPGFVLKRQLQTALAALLADDGLIRKEGGSESLTRDELRAACFARAIPVLDGDMQRMQRDLSQWIEWTTKTGLLASPLECFLCHALLLSGTK